MNDTTTAPAKRTVASTFNTVVGFLNHHVTDLNAMATVMQGLLAAVPVNAETRASINQAITRIVTSGENIVTSLANLGALEQPTFHIAESDIAKALSDEDGKAVLSQLIADYLAKHPQTGGVTPQVDQGAGTAAEAGDLMQAGDRQGSQQTGTGKVAETQEHQVGVTRQEEAPAPSSATSADQRAAGE